jgi:hypothetical protein
MSLLELQRDVRAWLVREDRRAARRLGEGAAAGLDVYLNTYRAQLIACLEDEFAHTRAWLGPDLFLKALATHIDRVPPGSWTLDAYPRDFPATLSAIFEDDPEVGELAWIECALGEAFVGRDAPVLRMEELGEVDWDTAVLRLVPTFDYREMWTNAAALWSSLHAGEVPPPMEHLAEGASVIVWRRDHVSHFRTTDAQELMSLLLIRSGVPFEGLCTRLVDTLGEERGVEQAGQYLAQWVSEGLVAGFAYTED